MSREPKGRFGSRGRREGERNSGSLGFQFRPCAGFCHFLSAPARKGYGYLPHHSCKDVVQNSPKIQLFFNRPSQTLRDKYSQELCAVALKSITFSMCGFLPYTRSFPLELPSLCSLQGFGNLRCVTKFPALCVHRVSFQHDPVACCGRALGVQIGLLIGQFGFNLK